MSRPVLALVIAAATLLVPASVAGKLYRWVDANGTVHYSDQPPRTPAPPIEKASPPPPPADPTPVEPARPAPALPKHPAPPAPVASPRPTPPASAPPRRPEAAAPTPRAPSGPPASRPTAPSPSPAREADSGSGTGKAKPSMAPGRAAAAAAKGTESIEIAREIVELSGIDQYLENLGQIVRGEFGRFFWQLDDGQMVWRAVAPLFRRDVMVASAAEALAQRLDSPHAPALLDWLRSPLYRRIHRLETEAWKPASQAKYREFVSRLPDAGIPPRRLAIVRRMERASQATEFQIQMERAVRQGLRRALQPLLAEHGPGEDVDRVAHDERERMRMEVLTAALFAYRSLSDAELAQYARFDASPAGQWASGVLRECLTEALHASERRAAAAVKMLAKRRAQAR